MTTTWADDFNSTLRDNRSDGKPTRAGSTDVSGGDQRDSGRRTGIDQATVHGRLINTADVRSIEVGPLPVQVQPAAFFTSSAIFRSSSAVSFVSAHDVAHIEPSSSFAASSMPNVA